MDKLNLLPWREKKLKKIIFSICVINLIALFFLLLSIRLYEKKLNLQGLKKNNVILSKKIITIKHKINVLDSLIKQKEKIEKIRQKNTSMLDTFISISRLTPIDLLLYNITMTPDDISIEGLSSSQESMGKFSDALLTLVYFNKQKSTTISNKQTNIHFKMELKHEAETDYSY